MKALKYLLITTIFLLSPMLHAAEVFVSHYETLHNMTAHTIDAQSANASQTLQRDELGVLRFEALGKSFDLNLYRTIGYWPACPRTPRLPVSTLTAVSSPTTRTPGCAL